MKNSKRNTITAYKRLGLILAIVLIALGLFSQLAARFYLLIDTSTEQSSEPRDERA